MVGDVARDDVGQRADGDGAVTRDSASGPGVGWQGLEQRNSTEAQVFELLDEFRPGGVVGVRHLSRNVLIEAGQRVIKTTRKPERAAGEQPLTVVHVVQHLANRPLSRRV